MALGPAMTLRNSCPMIFSPRRQNPQMTSGPHMGLRSLQGQRNCGPNLHSRALGTFWHNPVELPRCMETLPHTPMHAGSFLPVSSFHIGWTLSKVLHIRWVPNMSPHCLHRSNPEGINSVVPFTSQVLLRHQLL
eukprot:UN13643